METFNIGGREYRADEPMDLVLTGKQPRASQIIGNKDYQDINGLHDEAGGLLDEWKKLSPEEQSERKEELFAKAESLKERVNVLDTQHACLASIIDWLEANEFRFEPVSESAWHQVVEQRHSLLTCEEFGEEADVPAEPHVFILQHNWAKAFEGATDYSQGEFRLPYEVCCFELKISGRRICAIVREGAEDRPCIFIKAEGMWFYGVRESFMEIVLSQIRAVSIALDAEVAEHEVIRAPHKLNQARVKRGHVPLRDFHIVTLSRRSRAAPVERDGDEPKFHKRLHFVRGHWRHYADHKTWIKWHLRGDFNLGFIDKHYKL